jgi:glucose-6-phosphate-specific signal transduction histidine kinase
VVDVEVEAHDTVLRLAIRHDGIGGAEAGEGSGLVGLRDQIEALRGALQVFGPPGEAPRWSSRSRVESASDDRVGE